MENLMDKIVSLCKRRGFIFLTILFERSETTKWSSAKA